MRICIDQEQHPPQWLQDHELYTCQVGRINILLRVIYKQINKNGLFPGYRQMGICLDNPDFNHTKARVYYTKYGVVRRSQITAHLSILSIVNIVTQGLCEQRHGRVLQTFDWRKCIHWMYRYVKCSLSLSLSLISLCIQTD